MSNTNKHQNKLQKQIDKLSNLIKNNDDKVKEFQSKIEELEKENLTHSQLIQFYKDTLNLTPTILYNSGRDKKYVYGKVWWFSDGMGSKKKGYRYFLGKMDEKKPQSFWEEKLLNNFFEKEMDTIKKLKV